MTTLDELRTALAQSSPTGEQAIVYSFKKAGSYERARKAITDNNGEVSKPFLLDNGEVVYIAQDAVSKKSYVMRMEQKVQDTSPALRTAFARMKSNSELKSIAATDIPAYIPPTPAVKTPKAAEPTLVVAADPKPAKSIVITPKIAAAPEVPIASTSSTADIGPSTNAASSGGALSRSPTIANSDTLVSNQGSPAAPVLTDGKVGGQTGVGTGEKKTESSNITPTAQPPKMQATSAIGWAFGLLGLATVNNKAVDTSIAGSVLHFIGKRLRIPAVTRFTLSVANLGNRLLTPLAQPFKIIGNAIVSPFSQAARASTVSNINSLKTAYKTGLWNSIKSSAQHHFNRIHQAANQVVKPLTWLADKAKTKIIAPLTQLAQPLISVTKSLAATAAARIATFAQPLVTVAKTLGSRIAASGLGKLAVKIGLPRVATFLSGLLMKRGLAMAVLATIPGPGWILAAGMMAYTAYGVGKGIYDLYKGTQVQTAPTPQAISS